MTAGDVVLLRFPFSDLSGVKLRPAIVLAIVDRDEFVACQVTSKHKVDRSAVELTDAAFIEGGLRMTSYARASKLFTADRTLMLRRIGRLRDDVYAQIRDAAVRVIRGR